MLLSCSLLYLEHLVVPSVWAPLPFVLSRPWCPATPFTPHLSAYTSPTFNHLLAHAGGRNGVGRIKPHPSCPRQGWMTLGRALVIPEQ